MDNNCRLYVVDHEGVPCAHLTFGSGGHLTIWDKQSLMHDQMLATARIIEEAEQGRGPFAAEPLGAAVRRLGLQSEEYGR